MTNRTLTPSEGVATAPRDADAEPVTVRVDRDSRGGWEVILPDEPEPVRCDYFEEATRVARLRAAGISPCELIVCDAYNRVLHHELVTAAG